jgi:hypothetical protein
MITMIDIYAAQTTEIKISQNNTESKFHKPYTGNKFQKFQNVTLTICWIVIQWAITLYGTFFTTKLVFKQNMGHANRYTATQTLRYPLSMKYMSIYEICV